MLLDKHYEIDEEKRIDKAFRHIGQDPDDEQRFDCYVRGWKWMFFMRNLIENVNDPE